MLSFLVVVTQVTASPVQKLVQETMPRPAGYYQKLILDALELQ